MARRLSDDGSTVTLQVKMPAQLKAQAKSLARVRGDGDLSAFVRDLIRREWRTRQDARRARAEEET